MEANPQMDRILESPDKNLITMINVLNEIMEKMDKIKKMDNFKIFKIYKNNQMRILK